MITLFRNYPADQSSIFFAGLNDKQCYELDKEVIVALAKEHYAGKLTQDLTVILDVAKEFGARLRFIPNKTIDF